MQGSLIGFAGFLRGESICKLTAIDGLTPDRTIFQALGAMKAGRLILGLTISINSVYGAETKSTRIRRRP
jgi:hypothetical protein